MTSLMTNRTKELFESFSEVSAAFGKRKRSATGVSESLINIQIYLQDFENS